LLISITLPLIDIYIHRKTPFANEREREKERKEAKERKRERERSRKMIFLSY